MNNYATATIEGFVTKIPTSKSTKTGKNICTFSLAINHYTTSEAPAQVSYIDVETWEKMAKFCSTNVEKGKRVMIIGNLKQERWLGEDGKNKSKIKIIGKEIRFLESKVKEVANE